MRQARGASTGVAHRSADGEGALPGGRSEEESDGLRAGAVDALDSFRGLPPTSLGVSDDFLDRRVLSPCEQVVEIVLAAKGERDIR